MELYKTCQSSIDACLQKKTFAVAHLYSNEKTMDPHVQDCYEIYYSISGGKQFLIDNKLYDIEPGDVFFINQFEIHNLIRVDDETHERFVCNIYPEYLAGLNTEQTRLDQCFGSAGVQNPSDHMHQIHLSCHQQSRFLYMMKELQNIQGFGSDIKETIWLASFMVFLSECFQENQKQQENEESTKKHNPIVDEILAYIDQNLNSSLHLEEIARQFYISQPYMCKIFKMATGTTINKYITAKRISCAKQLISQGQEPSAACMESGFNDYSNFYRAFKSATGISPKKYFQMSR